MKSSYHSKKTKAQCKSFTSFSCLSRSDYDHKRGSKHFHKPPKFLRHFNINFRWLKTVHDLLEQLSSLQSSHCIEKIKWCDDERDLFRTKSRWTHSTIFKMIFLAVEIVLLQFTRVILCVLRVVHRVCLDRSWVMIWKQKVISHFLS